MSERNECADGWMTTTTTTTTTREGATRVIDACERVDARDRVVVESEGDADDDGRRGDGMDDERERRLSESRRGDCC
jgi:hypothetical protein